MTDASHHYGPRYRHPDTTHCNAYRGNPTPKGARLQDGEWVKCDSSTHLQDEAPAQGLTTGTQPAESIARHPEQEGFGVLVGVDDMPEPDPSAPKPAKSSTKASRGKAKKKAPASIRVVTPAQTLPNRPLKKHVAAIHTDGHLSLLQRKLSNVLLLNAYDALLTQTEHEIDEKTLCVMLGYDSNDRQPLKESLKALATVHAEWNILGDNQEEVEWGVSSLLSHAVLSKGRCRYGYSPALAEKLYNPDIYASINMRIQRKFRSKHALALYENCYRFKTVKSTGWWTLKTFRRLMGVDDSDYYAQFKHLNAKVIKPTVKEINAVSDIEITPEFKKSGRSISEIRFLIGANPQLPLLDIDDDNAVKGTTVYKRLVASGISHKLAESWIAQHGEDYCASKLDLMSKQKASGANIVSVAGYLSAAIKQDYQADPKAGAGQGTASASRADERRAKIEAEASAKRAEAETREAEKRAHQEKVTAAREWFESRPAEEQARLLSAFEATLDKPFLRADYKRARLNAPAVAARFSSFVDLFECE
ncbi:RepB family plasmid replication initiator protein [Litorimonas sp. WD9-15]|uniref:replication initiation protein n=1 Tax=Litorimonas sp. WD9-15 TaxID=3418716 RepID=UPI003CFFB2DE